MKHHPETVLWGERELGPIERLRKWMNERMWTWWHHCFCSHEDHDYSTTQPELDRWRKEWNQKTGNINTILLPDDEQAGAAAALLSLSDNAEGIFNHHGARGTSQMKAEMYKERVSLISVNNFNALRHLLLLLGLPNLVSKQAVLEQHKDIQAWSWWSIAEKEIICPGIDKGKDNAFRDVDINKIRGRDSFSEVL